MQAAATLGARAVAGARGHARMRKSEPVNVTKKLICPLSRRPPRPWRWRPVPQHVDAELSFCANTFVRESILADVPRAYSECEAVEYRTPVPSLQGY